MKRKVNRVGQSTLTVSLPAKWVKTTGIKAGDEIELTEDGSALVLGTARRTRSLEIEVDLSDAGVMLNRIIAAIYKAGFDTANISYKNAKELEIIQHTVYRSCHVYEIMNVRKNIVEIKSISELDPRQFNQIMRKMAHAIIMIAKETHEALTKNDFEELPNLVLKDQVIDRHTDFCRRILNKGHEVSYERTGPLYVLCEQTEIAADILKRISAHVASKKDVISPQILALLNDIIRLMEAMYDALFNFKMDKIREIGKNETKLRKDIDKLCETQKKNIKVLSYIINLFETIFEMKSAVLTLNVGE